MTNKEACLIFALIETEHERFEASEGKARLWATILQDVPYKVVELAVMTLLAKSPYPPKLSDITKSLEEITSTNEQKITSTEAWGEVTRAISCFGHNREVEAMSSLSPLTAKIVKSIGFRNICSTEEDVLGVVRGQFLRMFDAQKTKEHNQRVIPKTLQEEINKLSRGMSMEFIGDGEG